MNLGMMLLIAPSQYPRRSLADDFSFLSNLLLKLDSPVIITDSVIPICLPYEDSDYDLLKTGAKATYGWGQWLHMDGVSGYIWMGSVAEIEILNEGQA